MISRLGSCANSNSGSLIYLSTKQSSSLIHRSQYFAAVNRFGFRGPGRKVYTPGRSSGTRHRNQSDRKGLGKSHTGTMQTVYQDDLSVRVCKLHIIMSYPSHPMSYPLPKTNIKSEGFEKVTALKFENRSYTQSCTSRPT